MKSIITLAFALLSAVCTAQIVGVSHTSKMEITQFDTLVVGIIDPVEFDGYYHNISDGDSLTFQYVFTPHRGVFVRDCNGIEYTIRQTNHKDCPILHVEIIDPYWQMKLSHSIKE